MYIYYLLFFLLIVGYNIYNNGSKSFITIKGNKYSKYVIFATVSLTLIMGLRAETVGSDTEQYAVRYANTLARFALGRENPEIGFDALQLVFYQFLNIGYNGFIFFIALVCSLSMGYFINKYAKDELTALFVFIMLLLSMYMSGIRQCTALSLCIGAFVMADKRKPLLYIIFMALAYTIHNSCIVFLPVYLLWYIRLTRFQALLVFLFSISALIYRPYVTPIIEYLAPAKYEDMAFNMNYAINPIVLAVSVSMILFALFFVPVEDDGKKKKLSQLDSVFYIFMCIYLFFQIMSISNGQLWRLSFYYTLGFIALVPNTIWNNKKMDKSSKSLVRFIICFMCILHFFIGIRGDILQIDDYKFFWEDVHIGYNG